jgi:hypothetical protein
MVTLAIRGCAFLTTSVNGDLQKLSYRVTTDTDRIFCLGNGYGGIERYESSVDSAKSRQCMAEYSRCYTWSMDEIHFPKIDRTAQLIDSPRPVS